MKNKILFFIFISIYLFFNISDIYSQSGISDLNGWISNNPFKTDVFVENLGQFDGWAKSSMPIKYTINKSDKIFFTNQGVIFRLEKTEQLSEEEREKQERQDQEETSPKSEIFYVSMNWEGCNPDAELIADEQTEGYYTFGDKGYEAVKAKGYKKLLYKNMYPNIDVEYIIPEKGGIKYKLILHPDADVSKIKMLYSGDIEKLRKDKQDNLIIKTLAGDITDHAPLSYHEENDSSIASSFIIKGNSVSFQFKGEALSKISHTIIIDPWITLPSGLLNNYLALDIDHDNFGNVYVSGGSAPFMLSKYTNNGSLLWTFTNPSFNWSYLGYYSEFCLLPNSGTTYIGEGWSGPSDSTARIMKISSSGTLIYTSQKFGTNNEIFKIIYNNCNKKLIAFGGGTHSSDNIKIIADTNLSSSISKNFNAYSCNNNDIVSAVLDNNGDFFALSTDAVPFCTAIEGHLQKSLFSTAYSPPCAFDVQTSYYFVEVNLFQPYPNSIYTVRANVLALNSNYLFSYDGKILKAWNKSNGSQLGSIIIDTSYTAGNQRTHEGIDVDECSNVYVGGTNKVHSLSFNGTAFTVHPVITTNISNEVRDLKLNKNLNKLYVCGNGFVTELNAPISCNGSTISTVISITTDSCSGSACVSATGGIPPYNYMWSNGSANNCIISVPIGIYTVTVTDNSCNFASRIDTVAINSYFQTVINPSTPVICSGDSITLIGSTNGFGISYHWNNGPNGNTISVSPILTTTYTLTATNNFCIDTAKVTVTVKQPKYVSINPTICQGSMFPVGIHLYSSAGIYHDTLLSNIGCDSIITCNLTVNPTKFTTLNQAICQGEVFSVGIHNYSNTGIYKDTIVSYSGCDSIITTHLTVNPKKQLTINPSICQGKSFVVGLHNYTSAGTYRDTLLTSFGCDSIVIINLSVNPNKQTSTNPVICQGEVFNIGTHTYTAAGTYIDTLLTFSGCDSIVTTNLTVKSTSQINLYPVLCQGEIFYINNHSYSSTGIYSDTLINFTGCDSIIYTHLTIKPLPIVNLGYDGEICEWETIELRINPGYTSYLWQDGSTNNNFVVTKPGIYWIIVNNNNCIASDTIIYYKCNEINIWIPNAFTPDGDGVNDIFKIETTTELSDFQMYIYNRWGQQIFETTDLKSGWDGSFMGNIVPMGVYTYNIRIKEKIYNQERQYSGRVTLIR
ncbi:MAG: gliding motility-associated C-terminal domain-containing protein [Bacteroidetes bacterium]|nr:gliding motility-associated C-terminal domain-containing protein [Bacteroidota bacterium]